MTKCQKEQKYLFELALKEKKITHDNFTSCHTTDTLCSQMVTKWSASLFKPFSLNHSESVSYHQLNAANVAFGVEMREEIYSMQVKV